MILKEQEKSQWPRERMIASGATSLSETELFGIILKTGIRNKNVLELSGQIVKLLHEEKHKITLPMLTNIKGIGKAKACQILAVYELSKRLRTTKKTNVKIKDAKNVFDLLKTKFEDSTREEFIVIYLDTKLSIIDYETLYTGTLDSVIIHPREIFNRAIKHLAFAIILAHNHPSGDCKPSAADLQITKTIEKAGSIMGIQLLDHVIIGKDKFWSYAEDK